MTDKQRFLEICHTQIKREGLDKLLDWLEKSDFYEAPASTKYHGNYAGGLLQHSLNVYDCLKRIASHYADKNVSEESIAIAALFHDVCKVNFYQKGYRNVKDEHGKWVQKEIYEINEKFPIGHGEKSCILLQWFFGKLEVPELLAIRYHMGFSGPEDANSVGSAFSKFPLAFALATADMEASYFVEGYTQKK